MDENSKNFLWFIGKGVILFFIVLSVYTLIQNEKADRLKEPCKTYVYKEIPIRSLETTNNMQGSFFIGIGSIGSSPKYYVYQKGDIGYVLKDYYASSVEIVEDDTKFPAYVETHTSGNCNTTYWIHEYLRVPNGTIKVQYETGVN